MKTPNPPTVNYGTITVSSAEPSPNWHQVKIDRVNNGFIVEIGCKKFVGEKWADISKKLGEYWADPVAAQKKYCK